MQRSSDAAQPGLSRSRARSQLAGAFCLNPHLACAFADRASALLKLPAPSKLQARLIRSCQGTPLLHNNRLAGGAGGLPPELQHPAFGVFTDWMWGGRRPHDMEAGSPSVSSPEGPQPSPETQYQLDEQDMRTAAELCDAAFPYYGTEVGELVGSAPASVSPACPAPILSPGLPSVAVQEELQQRVVPLLQKYFGDVAPWSLLSGLFAEGGRSELKPDWYAGHMQGPSGLGMRRYLAITGILLLLLEMKNGLKCDTDGDPGLQGFGYYSKFQQSPLRVPIYMHVSYMRTRVFGGCGMSPVRIVCTAGRFWASRLTSSATSKAAWEVLRRSCAPALLIEGEPFVDVVALRHSRPQSKTMRGNCLNCVVLPACSAGAAPARVGPGMAGLRGAVPLDAAAQPAVAGRR